MWDELSGQEYVFISYSSKEYEQALLVKETMNREGIACWMAPKSIPPGSDYSAEIFEAISGCAVFVLILSGNSMDSMWVPKELDLAINNKKTIVPFQIDDSRLNGSFLFYLCNVQKILAYQEVQNALHELLQRIQALLKGKAASAVIEPSPVFQGPSAGSVARPDVTAEIEEHFRHTNIVSIHGVGGMGKSEAARMYVKNKLDSDEVRLVAHYAYQQDLKTTIANMQFTNFDDMAYAAQSRAEDERNLIDILFEKKTELLRCCSEDILLVIDGMDQYEDPDIDVLQTFRCKVLITTRCVFRQFAQVELQPFETAEERNSLFAAYYEDYAYLEDREKECVRELIEAVGCHTLAVKLLAQVMYVSGMYPEELLQAFRSDENKMLSFAEEVEHEHRYALADEHIEKIFDLSALSAQERDVLEKLSYVPETGVDKRLFRAWNAPGVMSVADRLYKKGWIQSDKGKIALHGIVHSVISRKRLDTSESRQAYFRKMAEYLRIENITGVAQRQDAAALANHLAKTVREGSAAACELLIAAGTYLDDYYYWLMVCVRNVYQFTTYVQFVNTKNENLAFFNLSLDCFRRAEEIMKEHGTDPYLQQKIESGLGCTYFNINAYAEAKAHHTRALQLRTELFGEYHVNTSGTRRRLGTSCMYLGDYEEALACYQKNLKHMQTQDGDNWYQISKYLFDCGKAYECIGDIRAAVNCCDEAICLVESYTHEEYLGIGELYYAAARMHRKAGSEKAKIRSLLESAKEMILHLPEEGNREVLQEIEAELEKIES